MNMDVNLRRLPGLFSYRSKFLVPLAALKMHPYFGEPGSYHVKHWKDCFDNRKKNMRFRTAAFHIKNNLPCIPGTIFKILYFLAGYSKKAVQSEAYWQPLRYCRNLQWLQSYGRSLMS